MRLFPFRPLGEEPAPWQKAQRSSFSRLRFKPTLITPETPLVLEVARLGCVPAGEVVSSRNAATPAEGVLTHVEDTCGHALRGQEAPPLTERNGSDFKAALRLPPAPWVLPGASKGTIRLPQTPPPCLGADVDTFCRSQVIPTELAVSMPLKCPF